MGCVNNIFLIKFLIIIYLFLLKDHKHFLQDNFTLAELNRYD